MSRKKKNKKSGVVSTILGNLKQGKIFSVTTFRNHFGLIFVVFVIFVIGITIRLHVEQQHESIRRLRSNLELEEGRKMRAVAKYQTCIGESQLRQLSDTLHLGLSVADEPCYILE